MGQQGNKNYELVLSGERDSCLRRTPRKAALKLDERLVYKMSGTLAAMRRASWKVAPPSPEGLGVDTESSDNPIHISNDAVGTCPAAPRILECDAAYSDRKALRRAIFELSKKMISDTSDLDSEFSLRLEDLVNVSPEKFAISVVPLRADIVFIDHLTFGDHRFAIIFEDSFDGSVSPELGISDMGTHQVVFLKGEEVLSVKCAMKLSPSMFQVVAFSRLK